MPEIHRMRGQLATLAAEQAGVISVAQMRALGLTHRAVEVRAARGDLHRIHRGVYVVGARRVTPTGRLWAAVLACGGRERAAISHLTAAAVWKLRPWWPAPVDVTTLHRSHPRTGINVHSSRTLTLDDLTRQHGLPITTPARTLIDVTPSLDDDELLRACNEALFHGRIDPQAIGPPRLREALARLTKTGPYRTKSDLEDQLLALVDRHGLPRPLVNVPLNGYTVDFFWPAQEVIVETDGRNHLRPLVYEGDRERDAHLQELGYRVYRVTSRQLDERPDHVARRLARWLA
jgi:very-short-patch-repair endonuclease